MSDLLPFILSRRLNAPFSLDWGALLRISLADAQWYPSDVCVGSGVLFLLSMDYLQHLREEVVEQLRRGGSFPALSDSCSLLEW